MSEWIIKPSYKLDLACFCNLFTEDQLMIDRHQDAYGKFIDRMRIRPDFFDFAKSLQQQGILIGGATASLLSLTDEDSFVISRICEILDSVALRPLVLDYLDENGLSSEAPKIIETILPVLSDMLHFIHESGFLAYWIDECQPLIQQKCDLFSKQAAAYPVVSKVNQLLGFKSVNADQVSLFLCSLSAPYGIGLKNAFISDIRWQFKITAAVAVHELIHPPFSRLRIKEITEILWEDDFLKEAKSRLPVSSGYHLPEQFVEENLVEGTHIFLSEEMGIEENPLKYLIEHDHASHVLSVILYDALKQGYRDRTATIEETINLLMSEGKLIPGHIRNSYMSIYKKAGLQDMVPFQSKTGG